MLYKRHKSPKSEPALELISTAASSVDAHHWSVGPDAGRNSRGRRIIIKKIKKSLPDNKLEAQN